MNKKILFKITAFLCITTIFTSGLTQVSYASNSDNSHPYCHGLIITPEEEISIKLNATEQLKKLSSQKDNHDMNILCVKSILEYAKKINILSSILTEKDNDGNTALKYALNNQKIFEIILKYAEDAGVLKDLLTSANNEGKTILMYAASHSDDNPIIDLILSYAEKAGILETVLNATTTSKFNNCSFEHSALTFAVEYNQLNNAKKLIEKGCNGIKCLAGSKTDISLTTHKPIIKSLIQYKNFDMVKLLFENDKFDDLKKPKLGMDKDELLKLIKENKETEVFDMLQKWSVDVTFFTGYKPTPTLREILSNIFHK